MNSINIGTTQNVAIHYELAPYLHRLLAFILDYIIMTVIQVVLVFLGIAAFENQDDETSFLIFYFFVILPTFLFYTLLFEIFNNGRSIGKLALGIKVIKLNGTEPEVADYISRWGYRWLDIYGTAGGLATILINSNARHQRLGDLIAGTTVVKMRPGRSASLKEVLNIKSKLNYEPKYPEVARLSEKDMLLIKTTKERAMKYPNPAHKEAMSELVSILTHQLALDKAPKNQIRFLNTLINDYIVLTR